MSTVLRVMVVVAALASVARAQEPVVSARDHYNRGSTLFDLGRFGEAAREFEAAYESKNDPALLYNIGQAYRADGNYAKALVAYKAFLRKSDDKSRRGDVEARIAELQQLIEDQKRASSRPPTGTLPPTDKTSPTVTPPPHGAEAEPASTVNPPAALVGAPPAAQQEKQPAYKKWWLWTIVGVAAAGAATGIAVALTTPKDAAIPSGATPVSFH
jgi:tetratricopeptide (TPR) repeat protein